MTDKMSGWTRVDFNRTRLTYEQFGSFLANVKELNSHKQTKEVCDLIRSNDIFTPARFLLFWKGKGKIPISTLIFLFSWKLTWLPLHVFLWAFFLLFLRIYVVWHDLRRVTKLGTTSCSFNMWYQQTILARNAVLILGNITEGRWNLRPR